MKIVYLGHSIIPSRAANSIHVMKMCQAFATNGHSVTLIVPDRKDGVEEGVADVFKFYGVSQSFEIAFQPWLRARGRGYWYGLAAARESTRRRPDLVYGRNLTGCYLAALMGLPVIFESHSPVAESGVIPGWLLSRLIRHPQFKKLVVISEALKEHYIGRYKGLVGRIQVLSDGADPVSTETLAANIPGRSGSLQVGYIGNLYKGRGIDLLISLARRLPSVDFHFVGGAECDVDRWRSASAGIGNVYFHGFVAPSSADAYRLAFDVLLAPYQTSVSVHGSRPGNIAPWMSPLKVFEYMAAGKAIVASDLPVLREVLRHRENSMLCGPDDVDAWVSTLEYLAESASVRKDLGSAARAEFERKYSWSSRARAALQ